MSFTFSTRILRVALAALTALLFSPRVEACTFDMITVLPAEQVNIGTAVSLELVISTTSSPAFLPEPAVVTIDGNFIEIDFVVETGVLTTLDTIVETFDLGQLPAGTYDYAIMGTSFGTNCEASPLPGSFVVVPEPNAWVLGLTCALVLCVFGRRRRRA